MTDEKEFLLKMVEAFRVINEAHEEFLKIVRERVSYLATMEKIKENEATN